MPQNDDLGFVPSGANSSSDLGFQPLNAAGRPTEHLSATHFTDQDPQNGVISGARRGGHNHVESHRVHKGKGAPAGIHVVRDGSIAPQGAGDKAFGIKKNVALAKLDNEPIWHNALMTSFKQYLAAGVPEDEAHLLSLNDAEHAIKDAGFDGYTTSKYPSHAFLYGDHRVHLPGDNAK